jgi:hypothetical protein
MAGGVIAGDRCRFATGEIGTRPLRDSGARGNRGGSKHSLKVCALVDFNLAAFLGYAHAQEFGCIT